MTKLKAPRQAKPVGAAPKAKSAPKVAKAPVEKVAKPANVAAPRHDLKTSWTGPSTVMNSRASRTPIDYRKFGTLDTAPLTDRDRKSLADLRAEFKQGTFARANIDTGILRRLGERGLLAHVSGSDVAADAQFKLTARAFTKEAMTA